MFNKREDVLKSYEFFNLKKEFSDARLEAKRENSKKLFENFVEKFNRAAIQAARKDSDTFIVPFNHNNQEELDWHINFFSNFCDRGYKFEIKKIINIKKFKYDYVCKVTVKKP